MVFFRVFRFISQHTVSIRFLLKPTTPQQIYSIMYLTANEMVEFLQQAYHGISALYLKTLSYVNVIFYILRICGEVIFVSYTKPGYSLTNHTFPDVHIDSDQHPQPHPKKKPFVTYGKKYTSY